MANITTPEWQTPEYKTWTGIKQRCYNPKVKEYPFYGGRGITICEEWLNNPHAFIKYVGRRPTPRHSIDRINNMESYRPGNVKWSTKTEQCINRGIFKNNTSGVAGVGWHKRDKCWNARISVHGKEKHLGYFAQKSQAIKARKFAETELWGRLKHQ